MKNALVIILIHICLMVSLGGCDSISFGEGTMKHGMNSVNFNGHSYVVYRTAHGVAMIHSPDCVKCYQREKQ